MNKELQDKAWAALTDGMRKEVRIRYNATYHTARDKADAGFATLYDIFGEHNIKSTEYHDDKPAKSNHFVDVWFKYNVGDIVSFKGKVKKIIWRRNNNALVTYGAVSPRGGNEICVQESDLEPMFPKFKVGDKVFLKPMKSYATVSEVEHNGVSFCYKLDIFCTYVSEGRLERYTGQEQPLSLSDAELDEVIARLTAIRDRRRENDNELRKILKSYGAVFA